MNIEENAAASDFVAITTAAETIQVGTKKF
jgi:hypothetical protein